MLTPDYLRDLPNAVVELVSEAESDILIDMARRINKMGRVSDTTLWQYKKLQNLGASHEYILKRLDDFIYDAQPLLADAFKNAAYVALETDDKIYRAAGLNVEDWTLSPGLQQIVQTGLNRTNGLFYNLTRTTANTATQQFERALDKAFVELSSGAFNYQNVISRTVKELAEQGIASIVYPSGHRDYADVATRRALLTGTNQMAGTLQMARADQFGCDLVETTAHAGARADHAVWQGKIFSRSGASKKYPSFRESTGYGTGAGLCGWNCRHSFYPFFEGISETAYTRQQLADLNNATVKYNGEIIPLDKALEKQRYIERQIRKYKREYLALDEIASNTTGVAANLANWRTAQRNFTAETGLRVDTFRSQVARFGRSQAASATAQAKKR